MGRHSSDGCVWDASMTTVGPPNPDIWIIDIARNIRSRLTTDPGTDSAPVWSPDGARIAFEGRRSGQSPYVSN
jgi:Tol biopolymer transport system component